MGKFRKKPVVIEAVRNDGTWKPIIDWLQQVSGTGMIFQPGELPPITRRDDGSLVISTLEGSMRADIGDWIIQGVEGEIYPCKDSIFQSTYEAVE